jgi:broad specificity phosphatase PhoE
MAPKRIMFIRHAEKPGEPTNDKGVAFDGTPDDSCLTVLGWQRAGALAKFFSEPPLRPNIVFAAGEHSGKRQRPTDTVTPLVDLLNTSGSVGFIKNHLKDDLQQLVDDVMSRNGTVLVAWEHKRLPGLIDLLPDAPHVPRHWPDNRFDLVWILDRTAGGWSFSQLPQLLLAGDRATPIS